MQLLDPCPGGNLEAFYSWRDKKISKIESSFVILWNGKLRTRLLCQTYFISTLYIWWLLSYSFYLYNTSLLHRYYLSRTHHIVISCSKYSLLSAPQPFHIRRPTGSLRWFLTDSGVLLLCKVPAQYPKSAW